MKIAWIVMPDAHKACGISRLGRLQTADLINKAGVWFGHKPGLEFANNVSVISGTKPEDIEGMNLALGLFDYFGDYLNFEFAPFAWAMGGNGDKKMENLISQVKDITEKDVLIFAWVSNRTDSDYAIEIFLKSWEIESKKKMPGLHSVLIKIDTEAKTVEYEDAVFADQS